MKTKISKKGIDIIDLLDAKINGYYQSKGDYPSKIYMNKETKYKLFTQLKEMNISLSWADSEDNFKGIAIELKDEAFMEME